MRRRSAISRTWPGVLGFCDWGAGGPDNNVSGIATNSNNPGTGNYLVTLSKAMPSVNFPVAIAVIATAERYYGRDTSAATDSLLQVRTRDATGGLVNSTGRAAIIHPISM